MLFANGLAQVDKPPAERAPIAVMHPRVIYAADPAAPAAARALAPERLAHALEDSLLAKQGVCLRVCPGSPLVVGWASLRSAHQPWR